MTSLVVFGAVMLALGVLCAVLPKDNYSRSPFVTKHMSPKERYEFWESFTTEERARAAKLGLY